MTHKTDSRQGPDARSLAAILFRSCIERRQSVEDVLDADRHVAALAPRDRALLATILLTTFRHLGEIDAILGRLLDKPLPRKSGTAPDILRLGIAQLVFLEMPAHAVIDLSVRAAKTGRNAQHFSGLVNAVLRKVSAGGASLRAGLDPARLNTPGWLWTRWAAHYGADVAHEIAEAHAGRPALDLSLKGDAAPLADALAASRLPNGQLRLVTGHAPVPELAGFAEGAWWVQDVAATIPAALLGDVRGLRVLDLCAAPGGKTMQLAAAGAMVTAVDVSPQRLTRLEANLARTGLRAELRLADLLTDDLSGPWDAVLLDAPCSATGTIRRHPELPHLKQEGQIAELAGLQRRMLARAAEWVAGGGRLVYCTCSLEPEEGEEQIRAFLAADARFDLLDASLPWLPEAVRPEGWIRTLPSMRIGEAAGMDGFFAAVLRRRA